MSDKEFDENEKSGEGEETSADTKSKGAGKKKKSAELLEEIKKLEGERDELKDRMLRLHAETENFKRRVTKEKEDFQKYSNEKIARELLQVVDNLERAVAHAKDSGEKGALLEGVEMTLTIFHQSLDKLGVRSIDSVGETFDPMKHEAVQQIESADHEPNVVVSEFQKGYMLHERLLRPAMVVVSRPPAKTQEN